MAAITPVAEVLAEPQFASMPVDLTIATRRTLTVVLDGLTLPRRLLEMPQAAGPADDAGPAACCLVSAVASCAPTADRRVLPLPRAQCGSAAGIAPSAARLSVGAGLIAGAASAVWARARSSSSRPRDGTSSAATTAPTPNSTADTVNATV
jgi:hypothetical protein